MSIFNILKGASSQINALKHDPELNDYLLDDEKVEIAYATVRDYIAFTPLRIIIVDKQGVSGRKKEYQSVPYSKVLTFTACRKGMMELDAELRIYIMSLPEPISIKFGDNESLCAVSRGLAALVCR